MDLLMRRNDLISSNLRTQNHNIIDYRSVENHFLFNLLTRLRLFRLTIISSKTYFSFIVSIRILRATCVNVDEDKTKKS